jgi:DNA-binding CsgD family transcriptional regulator/PAS domain-containing protein
MSPEAFSNLVHAIYRCVLEPDQWPDVLRLVSEYADCAKVAITLIERDGSASGPFRQHGITPEWSARYKREYAADAANFFEMALAQPGVDLDEPVVLSRIMPPEQIRDMLIVREWATPQGLVDVMSSVILVTPSRIASVDTMRDQAAGLIDDESVAVMRALLPHFRRALAISDLIGLHRFEVSALTALIDTLALGLIIVDGDARVLQANVPARSMLEKKSPVRLLKDRLTGRNAAITRQLQSAIAQAGAGALAMTSQSTGISLIGGATPSAVAHVLPLGTGEVRSNLLFGAAAAVFIAGMETTPTAALDGIAATYGITPTEQRVLAEIARGVSIGQAAATLEMSVATARTHLKRIYAKLGVSRQAELVALVGRLVSPFRA